MLALRAASRIVVPSGTEITLLSIVKVTICCFDLL